MVDLVSRGKSQFVRTLKHCELSFALIVDSLSFCTRLSFISISALLSKNVEACYQRSFWD